MANLFALDIGEKRIGVAIADIAAPFPAPLTTLEASENLAAQFAELLKKHQVKTIVIGLPRNQSGERTAQSDRVEYIASLLSIPQSIPVYWQDESLTSVKAEKELQSKKKPYTKAAVDALAATYILEDFIHSKSATKHSEVEQNVEQQSEAHIAKKNAKKHPTRRRTLVIALIASLAAVLAVIGLISVWYINALSPRTKDDVYSVLSVESGSGVKSIASKLESQKIIRSATAFTVYVRMHNITNLQAGEYRLSSKQSVQEIAQIIASGKVTTINVLIAPGQTLDQIFTALEKDGFSQDDLQSALAAVRDHPLLKGEASDAKLEGYLFPDTYKIGPTTSAEQLFRLMLDTFQKKITPDIEAGVAAQGLTMHQAITLASIVQKEVGDPAVQPGVAQVFIKRYNIGMMLGSDVTALYGAVKDGVDLPSNTAQAAAIAIAHPSPYNTRKVTGLPPTAISNFNITALQAVARPATSDYLFFVAGDDGKTYFSSTVEEHEALVRQHCIKLCG